ncbi:MAG: hypothetical protein K0S39_769 [Paenibacillus sp.]|nr:hypothetical protein [Paenibacillus sp.]
MISSFWGSPTWRGAFLLGIGIIGMLDGILFHQILQWHSVYMHTDRAHQIVSDGFFHLAVTAVTFWASVVLWKSDPLEEAAGGKRIFTSGLLTGAGLFNFIEGIVNHHMLQLHHVKPGPFQTEYDLLFDASGLILIAAGLMLKPKAVRIKA